MRKATDPVPGHFLTSWGFTTGAPTASAPRARGKKGPGDGSDFKAAMLEGFGFAAGAFMQMSTQRSTSGHTSGLSTVHSVSRSPSPIAHIRSSSPPVPEDELDVCISRFSEGLTNKIPSDILDRATSALKGEDFDVQLLGQGSSSDIMQLTGLKRGPASGLKRFAEDFDGKLQRKRAHRK